MIDYNSDWIEDEYLLEDETRKLREYAEGEE